MGGAFAACKLRDYSEVSYHNVQLLIILLLVARRIQLRDFLDAVRWPQCSKADDCLNLGVLPRSLLLKLLK